MSDRLTGVEPRAGHGRQVGRPEPPGRGDLARRRRRGVRHRLPAPPHGPGRRAGRRGRPAPSRRQRRRHPAAAPHPAAPSTPRTETSERSDDAVGPAQPAAVVVGRPRAGRPRPGGRADLPRRVLRRGRRDGRRGGVLHRHDRLPGDAHRPELPPPGRGHDRPARRQHRRQRRGRRVAPHLGGRLRRARPRDPAVELARRVARWRTTSSSRASSASAASTPAPSPGTCASAARCGSGCSPATLAAQPHDAAARPGPRPPRR